MLEQLSNVDKYNEYVMTRLRTIEGVDLNELAKRFGVPLQEHFSKLIKSHMDEGSVQSIKTCYALTRKGQFIADRIASDLFYTD